MNLGSFKYNGHLLFVEYIDIINRLLEFDVILPLLTGELLQKTLDVVCCLNIVMFNSLYVTLVTTSNVFGGSSPVTKASETSSSNNKLSKERLIVCS